MKCQRCGRLLRADTAVTVTNRGRKESYCASPSEDEDMSCWQWAIRQWAWEISSASGHEATAVVLRRRRAGKHSQPASPLARRTKGRAGSAVPDTPAVQLGPVPPAPSSRRPKGR